MGFLGFNNWSDPNLAVSGALWESGQVGTGFLTPTPVVLPGGTLRIFGGVRDVAGRSVVCWADLDSESLKVVDFSNTPCFDTRDSDDFDTDGAILGDVSLSDGIMTMIYVGFRKAKQVKFQAFTGLATSMDLGITWTRQDSPFKRFHSNVPKTDIFAVHSMNNHKKSLEYFVAIGNGWEIINQVQYPKYQTYSLTGKNLESLELSSAPIIKLPKEVYRLGRPRYFFSQETKEEYLLATGGKRDGDYRPYIFKKILNEWVLSSEQFTIEPGQLSGFMKQVSYPSVIEYDSKCFAFFNGDDMGRAGCYVTQASKKKDLE